MEDNNFASSRRTRPSATRPKSSASSRMTPPQSVSSASNGSSINLPLRMGTSLLQERIRERKGERRRSVDFSGERAGQSSPMASTGEKRPSSGGKGMGVKQIEEHVSKLTKENFNLKLELHHRRERQTTLEERLGAAEKQIEDQRELQEVNEELLVELEKRDQAVEEAVGIIVSLEDKVNRLMQEREVVKNFDAEYDSTYYHSERGTVPSSSPKLEKKAKHVSRMPSFLSENSEGADALRSLYLPHNQTYNEGTLPRLMEEGSIPDVEVMDSPRLSVLSESSFVSVYGNKILPLDADSEEDIPARHHRKTKSVEKWIEERPAPTAPAIVRTDLPKSQYLSINDIVDSPLQRLEKLKNTLERNNASVISARRDLGRSSQNHREPPRKELRQIITNKPVVDDRHGLPPTPDTIGTNTLRNFERSNDTLRRNLVNTPYTTTATKPATPAFYDEYQAAILPRPRSAGETITSRRDGHGWDTESQDGVSSTTGTFSTEQFRHPQRAITPDLFSFSTFEDDFGRDVTFNHGPRNEYLRSCTADDVPRSNDTVRNDHQLPHPQVRRASLGHATRLRESRQSSSEHTTHPISQSSIIMKTDPLKKRGLTTRLFNRAGPALSQQARVYAAEERETATPPPIKRSRDSGPFVPQFRPGSAGGTGPSRRTSAFGGEDTQNYNIDSNTNIGDEKEKKKWFNLGRAGSLRRN